MRRRFASGMLALTLLGASATWIGACATLKRGYEAACIDACRAGGAAQGTSRCERGCRSR